RPCDQLEPRSRAALHQRGARIRRGSGSCRPPRGDRCGGGRKSAITLAESKLADGHGGGSRGVEQVATELLLGLEAGAVTYICCDGRENPSRDVKIFS